MEEAKHQKSTDLESPSIVELRAKEESDAIAHSSKHTHDRETHGTSDDIDDNTAVDQVKAPNIFERAKEEVEALVEAIHPSKKT